MEFLDQNKPIETCISDECDNCAVQKTLHCHFTLRDLIHFLLIASPSFLLGGGGIYHIGGWWLIPFWTGGKLGISIGILVNLPVDRGAAVHTLYPLLRQKTVE